MKEKVNFKVEKFREHRPWTVFKSLGRGAFLVNCEIKTEIKLQLSAKLE